MEKVKRKELVWRWIFIVTVVLFALSFTLIPSSGTDSIMLIMPVGALIWVFGLIYFINHFPLLSNLRRLEERNLSYVLDDISTEKPLCPTKKCKLFCGKYAFLCTAPSRVIPYSDIAWVYIEKKTMYGAITIEQSIVIYCKDNKKYTISGTMEECQMLLEQYILPQNQDVVLGFGKAQEQEYLRRNPQAVQSRNKTKFVWGIILLVIGVLLTTICIINYPVEIGGYVLVAAAYISGIILTILGKRK